MNAMDHESPKHPQDDWREQFAANMAAISPRLPKKGEPLFLSDSVEVKGFDFELWTNLGLLINLLVYEVLYAMGIIGIHSPLIATAITLGWTIPMVVRRIRWILEE